MAGTLRPGLPRNAGIAGRRHYDGYHTRFVLWVSPPDSVDETPHTLASPRMMLWKSGMPVANGTVRLRCGHRRPWGPPYCMRLQMRSSTVRDENGCRFIRSHGDLAVAHVGTEGPPMIVQRMRNGLLAAWGAGSALAAAALVTGLAAGIPASAATTGPHSFLASVSCASSTACIAVGGRAGHRQRDQILALSWNGARWSPQVPVDVNHTQPNDLNSIACTSPAECFAVGSVGNFNFADHRRLIEAWNGSAWSIQAFGNPKGTLNTFLESVSCGGPGLCFATGEKNDNTGMQPGVVLEKWNGAAWSVQPALPE